MERIADLECLVHEPAGYTATAVLLHGRGASADDLFPLGKLLPPHVRAVFPNAPYPFPHSTGFMWWDMPPNQRPGLEASALRVAALLDALADGDPARCARTVLGGFSQGSILTLDAGLRYRPRLAGLVCMSGYLMDESRASDGVFAAESPPICMLHGTFDDVIAVDRARRARAALEERGFAVQYAEFDMAHEISPASWRMVREFVTRAVP